VWGLGQDERSQQAAAKVRDFVSAAEGVR